MAKQEIIARKVIGHTCDERGECAFEVDVVAIDRRAHDIEISADTPYEIFLDLGRWLDQHDKHSWVVTQTVNA